MLTCILLQCHSTCKSKVDVMVALQAELEDKERKHFRTKGGSDFEGVCLMSHNIIMHTRQVTHQSLTFCCNAEQRQADLKLLEAPDIGTGIGGKPKVLIPKAVDADEENDDDDDGSESSSDDEASCMHSLSNFESQ